MSKVYDKLISIQRINKTTELWEDVYKLHAYINKARNNSEYLEAGAIQSQRALTIEVRYFRSLEDVANHTQLYRVLFDDVTYNITDTDNYKLQNKTFRMLGVSQ